MQRKIDRRQESRLRKVALAPWRLLQKAVSLLTLHTTSWWTGLASSWNDAPDYATLADHGLRNAFVFRIRTLIGQVLGDIPLVAQYEATEDGETVMQEDPAFALLTMMKRPNPEQSYSAFMQEMYDHLLFGGELFLYTPESPLTGPRAGLPTEEMGLRLIRPDRVRHIEYDENDEPLRYEVVKKSGRLVEIDAALIVHLKLICDPRASSTRARYAAGGVHAMYDDRGWPLLLSCWRQVQLMESGDDWNNAIAQNRGRIPGFFKYTGQGRFSDDQFKRTKEGIQEAWSRDTEQSRPGLLDGDYDFIEASTTQKDADFIAGDNRASRKIAAALGVPYRLLDDDKAGSLTDAGIDSEMKALLTLTALPLLGWFLAELSHRYGRRMADGAPRFLAPNLDQIAALQEDQTDRYSRFAQAVAAGLTTINEARQELGWEALPIEQADELFIPQSIRLLEQAGEMPDMTPSGAPSGDSLPSEDDIDLSATSEDKFNAYIDRLLGGEFAS